MSQLKIIIELEGQPSNPPQLLTLSHNSFLKQLQSSAFRSELSYYIIYYIDTLYSQMPKQASGLPRELSLVCGILKQAIPQNDKAGFATKIAELEEILELKVFFEKFTEDNPNYSGSFTSHDMAAGTPLRLAIEKANRLRRLILNTHCDSLTSKVKKYNGESEGKQWSTPHDKGQSLGWKQRAKAYFITYPKKIFSGFIARVTALLDKLYPKKPAPAAMKVEVPVVNIQPNEVTQSIAGKDPLIESLLNLAVLVNYPCPLVLSKLTGEQIISTLQLQHESLSSDQSNNPHELVKKYFQSEGNLTKNIDFYSIHQLIANNPFLKHFRPRDYVSQLDFHYYSIKVQLFLQLLDNKLINTNDVIRQEKTQTDEIVKKIHAVRPVDVGQNYFWNLICHPQQAENIADIYKSFAPTYPAIFEHECQRIRKVLIRFIDELSLEKRTNSQLDDACLMNDFIHLIQASEIGAVVKVNLEIMFAENSTEYNTEFFMRSLKKISWNDSSLPERIDQSIITNMGKWKPNLVLMGRFLVAADATLAPQLPSGIELLNLFYMTLPKLSLEHIVDSVQKILPQSQDQSIAWNFLKGRLENFYATTGLEEDLACLQRAFSKMNNQISHNAGQRCWAPFSNTWRGDPPPPPPNAPTLVY
ncbi:MAG: hypothetical protein H0U71_06355 [Gammaproteobacteria bacterium]|nr:hypothetical protein [Gammaproteobacteria bacterium]